jgi:hypothetical protein
MPSVKPIHKMRVVVLRRLQTPRHPKRIEALSLWTRLCYAPVTHFHFLAASVRSTSRGFAAVPNHQLIRSYYTDIPNLVVVDVVAPTAIMPLGGGGNAACAVICVLAIDVDELWFRKLVRENLHLVGLVPTIHLDAISDWRAKLTITATHPASSQPASQPSSHCRYQMPTEA